MILLRAWSNFVKRLCGKWNISFMFCEQNDFLGSMKTKFLAFFRNVFVALLLVVIYNKAIVIFKQGNHIDASCISQEIAFLYMCEL